MLVRRWLLTVCQLMCARGYWGGVPLCSKLHTGFLSWRSDCLPGHEGGDDPSDGMEMHIGEGLCLGR